MQIEQALYGRSTSRYCTFVGENLMTWKSKKQQIAARSSAEAKFKSIVKGICERMWLRSLMKELNIANGESI